MTKDEIITLIQAMTEATRSVAPREVASKVAESRKTSNHGSQHKIPDWRKFLPEVKSIARQMALDEKLVFVRKKRIIHPDKARGVVRYAGPDYREPDRQEAADEHA